MVTTLRLSGCFLRECDEGVLSELGAAISQVRALLNIREAHKGRTGGSSGAGAIEIPLGSRSLQELKSLCREKGLRVNGNEAALVKRLEEYDSEP